MFSFLQKYFIYEQDFLKKGRKQYEENNTNINNWNFGS